MARYLRGRSIYAIEQDAKYLIEQEVWIICAMCDRGILNPDEVTAIYRANDAVAVCTTCAASPAWRRRPMRRADPVYIGALQCARYDQAYLLPWAKRHGRPRVWLMGFNPRTMF